MVFVLAFNSSTARFNFRTIIVSHFYKSSKRRGKKSETFSFADGSPLICLDDYQEILNSDFNAVANRLLKNVKTLNMKQFNKYNEGKRF